MIAEIVGIAFAMGVGYVFGRIHEHLHRKSKIDPMPLKNISIGLCVSGLSYYRVVFEQNMKDSIRDLGAEIARIPDGWEPNSGIRPDNDSPHFVICGNLIIDNNTPIVNIKFYDHDGEFGKCYLCMPKVINPDGMAEHFEDTIDRVIDAFF